MARPGLRPWWKWSWVDPDRPETRWSGRTPTGWIPGTGTHDVPLRGRFRVLFWTLVVLVPLAMVVVLWVAEGGGTTSHAPRGAAALCRGPGVRLRSSVDQLQLTSTGDARPAAAEVSVATARMERAWAVAGRNVDVAATRVGALASDATPVARRQATDALARAAARLESLCRTAGYPTR